MATFWVYSAPDRDPDLAGYPAVFVDPAWIRSDPLSVNSVQSRSRVCLSGVNSQLSRQQT